MCRSHFQVKKEVCCGCIILHIQEKKKQRKEKPSQDNPEKMFIYEQNIFSNRIIGVFDQ